MVYPESSASKSTRPSGSGAPERNRPGHSDSGFALKPALILLAFMPGLKPRPTAPTGFSAACKALIILLALSALLGRISAAKKLKSCPSLPAHPLESFCSLMNRDKRGRFSK